MPRLGGCLPGLVLLVILFACPVALAISGKHVIARVVEKNERVKITPYTGNWYNQYSVVVHFAPRPAARAEATSRAAPSDSISLSVAATRDMFDRLRVGFAVDVVYLPYRPSIGKLTDRSLVDLLREILGVPGVRMAVIMVLAMAVAVFVMKRKPRRDVARVARIPIVAMCVAMAITALWRGYQNPESVSEASVSTSGLARVVNMRRIDRTPFSFSHSSTGSSSLAQPFDVVEVEFLSPLTKRLVHTADAVDAGSIKGLSPGQLLRIRYNARAPRTMLIEGGTRTFRARNSRDTLGQLAIVLGLILALAGISVLVKRKNHPQRS